MREFGRDRLPLRTRFDDEPFARIDFILDHDLRLIQDVILHRSICVTGSATFNWTPFGTPDSLGNASLHNATNRTLSAITLRGCVK